MGSLLNLSTFRKELEPEERVDKDEDEADELRGAMAEEGAEKQGEYSIYLTVISDAVT